MKITDMIYKFPSDISRQKDGLCRVRTFVNNAQIYVVLTDLGRKNPSSSVTNSIKVICNSLIEKGIVPESSTFVEHYEKGMVLQESTFDLISFHDSLSKWKKINLKDIISLIDCAIDEFNNLTENNKNLSLQIEQLLHQIDPTFGFPYQEHHSIIKRRLEIMDKQVKKKDLLKLVQSNANERSLSQLLKSDLSIFGELYADPKDEYICFSEFPIGDAIADFVLFTGRSRMDVFLIEIKGADFNLLTKNHYKNNTQKVNQCLSQLTNHYSYINRNYNEFKQSIHEIRQKVEAGKSLYNSCSGPIANLEVDSNKEIKLTYIAIAGNTINDLEESNSRHHQELGYNFPIKIETWSSLLNKLIRE